MERLKLNLVPGGVLTVCHASQYDNGRTVRFDLYDGDSKVTLAGTETITAKLRKPSGSEVTLNVTNTSSDYVDVVTDSDTCDEAGVYLGELTVVSGSVIIGSANFILLAEMDPYGQTQLVVRSASGSIVNFNTSVVDDLIECIAEFSASQASGTPTPASPIPIVGVDKVNITRTGKNLFRGYGEKTYIKSGTAYLLSSANTTGASRIRFQVFDKDNNVLSNVTALSGCNGAYYWSGNVLVRSNNITTLNDKIGFDDNRVSSILAIDDSSTAYHYVNYTNIQLELGSTATTYEAPTVVNKTINLGGTYYGGSVDAVAGKITLTHKKYVFDENLPQSLFGLTAVTGYTQLSYSPYINEGKANTVFLSDKFEFETGNVHSVYKCWNTTSVPRMFLALPDTVETKEDAISWFENNPTEVIAELATPIVVYASNTAEIPTINGDNQVFADTGDVAVKYYAKSTD